MNRWSPRGTIPDPLINQTGNARVIDLLRTHHVAIICSDYEKSKTFFTRRKGSGPQTGSGGVS